MEDVFGSDKVIDLGHGVKIVFYEWNDTFPAGMIEEHDKPDGSGRCRGSIPFDVPGVRENLSDRDVWQVESIDPLTLSPSLLCTVCGHHGFVRQGRWVPV